LKIQNDLNRLNSQAEADPEVHNVRKQHSACVQSHSTEAWHRPTKQIATSLEWSSQHQDTNRMVDKKIDSIAGPAPLNVNTQASTLANNAKP
jgi:hypothetical protein